MNVANVANIFAIILLSVVTSVLTASVKREWETFKVTYKKFYHSYAIEVQKFEVFKGNLNYIQHHNENSSVSFKLGLSSGFDLTDDEFNEIHKFPWWHFMNIATTWKMIEPQSVPLNESFEVPEAFNWAVQFDWNKIKDQNQYGMCGSSYAFASIAALEFHYAISSGNFLKLSEQEIIDCAENTYGCGGGNERYVYNYIINNGISLAEDYQYESKQGRCLKSSVPRSEVKVYGYAKQCNIEKFKQTIVEHGPIVVRIYSYPKHVRFYKEGIHDNPETIENVGNHFVLLIGYDRDEKTGLDYWIIRNSWSKDWGEDGYMRLLMTGSNFKINSCAYYPLLDESVEKDNKWFYYFLMTGGVIVGFLFLNLSCCFIYRCVCR